MVSHRLLVNLDCQLMGLFGVVAGALSVRLSQVTFTPGGSGAASDGESVG